MQKNRDIKERREKKINQEAEEGKARTKKEQRKERKKKGIRKEKEWAVEALNPINEMNARRVLRVSLC